MKLYTYLTCIAILLLSNCTEIPRDLLKQVELDLLSQDYISYKQYAYYPNPVGKIDTIEASTIFRKNKDSFFGYDFILNKKHSNMIYIDEDLKSVNHRNEKVVLFKKNEPKVVINYINHTNDIEYSPITLLRKKDWELVKDTLLNGQNLKNYFRIETDTVIDGNTVYTEQHIFLNPASKQLDRWERRNYYNGELSQKVIYEYSDYNFELTKSEFSYEFPENYTSSFYGQNKDVNLLKVGEKAPLFTEKDLQNKPLNLADYRGKKVLLNFSSVGCSYCHEAIMHINQEKFQLSEDIAAFYIAPFDEQQELVEYFDEVKAPFAVIPNAKKLGEIYGVTSTPTFFLIDEKGIIEKVIIGNDREFLDSLKVNG
ncbi:peroxiredoxin family protein [Algoriphagus machipongonensis]|uniref:Thiol-disulfide oxidoreductase ResA n=1 Tax=Algoriphagus machipongonensis TaxID=388413 RepID=A3HV25_9BACT|nr:TlpA disulfide reductase family protein [Algoriphagus machipongonensis]EAZ81997.1 putative thiol-disulfide oxidoreductase ResA [Algoriphagus machipongonensis]